MPDNKTTRSSAVAEITRDALRYVKSGLGYAVAQSRSLEIVPTIRRIHVFIRVLY